MTDFKINIPKYLTLVWDFRIFQGTTEWSTYCLVNSQVDCSRILLSQVDTYSRYVVVYYDYCNNYSTVRDDDETAS